MTWHMGTDNCRRSTNVSGLQQLGIYILERLVHNDLSDYTTMSVVLVNFHICPLRTGRELYKQGSGSHGLITTGSVVKPLQL